MSPYEAGFFDCRSVVMSRLLALKYEIDRTNQFHAMSYYERRFLTKKAEIIDSVIDAVQHMEPKVKDDFFS